MQQSGPNSGSLARIVPVIGLDREMVRLGQDRLPSCSFPLDGVKAILAIMEDMFSLYTSEDKPPVILKFKESALLNNFRLENDIKTNASRVEGNFDLKGIFSTLLDNQPPNCDRLNEEGSGTGRVNVFISQLEAEFRPLFKSPGDENALNGISTNLMRISCD